MSEQLSQVIPQRIGKYVYYRLGETTLNQLKKEKLIPNKNYGKLGNKKPDGIIIFQKQVKAIIESKKVSELNTKSKEDKAIKQEIEVAKSLCKLLIVTDNNSKTLWINALNREQIKGKKGNIIKTVFDSKLAGEVNEIENLIEEIDSSLGRTNSQLIEEKLIDPSQLANRIWQTIWAATGKSPIKCLYNVVELLIFKFLSDLKVLNDDYNFKKVYEISKRDPEDSLRYYARNSRIEIKKLFPSGDDGTTIMNGTIFVNETGEPNLSQSILFTRSLKHLQDYENDFGSFIKIDKQFKTRLYETFLKQEVEALGQYFTPRKIVQTIIRMSGLDSIDFQFEGKRICDPFCGVGGFPLEILNLNEKMKECYIPDDKGKINTSFVIHGFDKGFEREDERTIILAKANMLIYLADIVFKFPTLTKEFANQFNDVFKLFKDNLGTFRHIINSENEKYDYILTNPPYVTSGSGIIKEEIRNNGIINAAYPINAQGLEGLSIEWIIRSLKKGGQSYIIIPDGVLERIYDQKLRNYILKECYLNCIISLPVRTFFANFRKTYILGITKKHNINDEQKQPVFTYLVSNIGEALTKVTRDDIKENDLPEMEGLFGIYRGSSNKNSIKDVLEKQSLRCKLQPIERFSESDNWRIEKWWDKEEKIKLGIEEEKEEINPANTFDIMKKTKENINEYVKLMKNKEKNIGKFKEIKIGDLFNIKKGDSKYTKKYIKTHKGKYPLYSSQTKDNGIIGNIDSYDFDVDKCLTWTTDGI